MTTTLTPFEIEIAESALKRIGMLDEQGYMAKELELFLTGNKDYLKQQLLQRALPTKEHWQLTSDREHRLAMNEIIILEFAKWKSIELTESEKERAMPLMKERIEDYLGKMKNGKGKKK